MIKSKMIFRRDLNLAALTGPESPEKASPASIDSKLYNRVIDALRNEFDYIVVDTSVADISHDVFANCIIPQMDFMLVVTTPSTQTLLNVDQMLRLLTAERHAGGSNVDPRKIGIVLSQT